MKIPIPQWLSRNSNQHSHSKSEEREARRLGVKVMLLLKYYRKDFECEVQHAE